ncbi:nucleotidyltransferase domain-containing protein [Candidatus Pacearchaeota archaeon]|nr:nucleotidyltransferase domain-containing protein [Candidatus Pacearchaeota archaeon]
MHIKDKRGNMPKDNSEKKKESAGKKNSQKDFPTLKLAAERDIAMDFAAKVYEKFSKMVKSVVLFGSQVKQTATAGSDIDIIIIIDDAAIQWDQELIAWYREELGKLIASNPYRSELHINTVKITTWWQDLLRGDPVVINVLRYGETLLDFGGFFEPLKVLLIQGKIKSTPEAVYTCLQRAPQHLARSKASELGSVEGLYWAMVDSAHAALMSDNQVPPSPEHVPIMLKERFVDKKMLSMKYVIWYRDLYVLHRKIIHGDITDLKGADIDAWQSRADEFIRVMAELIKRIVR